MDVNQVGAHFYVDVHKMLPEGGEVDKFKFEEEASSTDVSNVLKHK